MPGLRWTVGDVHPRGFESLKLSLLGAWNIFGGAAAYTVCVNTIGVDEARHRTGDLRWLAADTASLLAEDVRLAFGQFGDRLTAPRNCGIVGLPPRFDYAAALAVTLQRRPAPCLRSWMSKDCRRRP